MLINKVLLENLIKESVADNTIKRAMDQKNALFFNYEGSVRTVDVYAIGNTLKGHPAIFGWLRKPSYSKSIRNPSPNPTRRFKDLIRWRIFRVDKMKTVMITKLPYLEDSQKTKLQKADYQDLLNAKKYFNKSQSGILTQSTTLDLNV